MHATAPSASPPRSPTVPDGGGLSDWKILSNDPILRTGRETVLPARRSRDGREAWLHVVTDNSPENINVLQRHFRTLAPVALPPDWATLAGSGVDDGLFYYLTQPGELEPLGRWMSSHPEKVTEELQLEWILQAARAARFALEKAHLGLVLSADMAGVAPPEQKRSAPRLVWSKLQPVVKPASPDHSAAVLASLEQIIHHVYGGNQWPPALRSAWIEGANTPAVEQVRRLEVHLEKMALPAIQGGAEPAPPGPLTVSVMEPASILQGSEPSGHGFKVTTENWGQGTARPAPSARITQGPPRKHPSYGLWGIGTVIGLLALLLVAQAVSWFSTRSDESEPPKADPPATPAPEVAKAPVVPAPVPQPPVDDAETKRRLLDQRQRQALAEASHKGGTREILLAARPLLHSQPQDPATRSVVQGVLEVELRRMLDDASMPSDPTAPSEGSHWQVWSDFGFPEARLLRSGWLLLTEAETAVATVKELADGGFPAAMTLLGQWHARGTGVPTNAAVAAKLYESAAGKGDRTATYLWAETLLAGKGVQRNPRAAIPWLQKAAEDGDARAMNLLGTCLLRGNGLTLNKTQAIEWFRKAVDAGNPGAMGNLATLLINGDGVKQDGAAAAALAKRGADLGHPYCTYLVALCEEMGFGMPPDPAKAAEHYRRAAALGHQVSKDWCRRHGISFAASPAAPSSEPSVPSDQIQ